MQHPMVAAADQCEVGQRRLTASGPPGQVMPVTPARRPAAVVDDTATIASHQRAAGGRGDPLVRMARLALQLRLSE